MNTNFRDAYDKGFEKINYMKNHLDDFPHVTRDGKWLKYKNGHWTGGFWTGLLWLEYLNTENINDSATAKNWAMRFRDRINDNKTHDQGFIFGPSCVMGYNITKDDDFIPLFHSGAQNMVDLFDERSGLILAWDEPTYQGIAIVDTIMNLPLLWISDSLNAETDKKELMKVVADNIFKYHVRDDFSTFHVSKWDDNYKISPGTHQGYSTYSCWSRGQAWALYGFANLFRYTGEKKYLDTSIQLAKYFYNNLNENLLPAWDFIYRDNPNHLIDAAAASIASSGMLLISFLLNALGDIDSSIYWRNCAINILSAEIEYCLFKKLNLYGIIENVVVDYPRQSGIGESSTYGDYYFMEALYRLQNIDNSVKTLFLY